MIRNERAKLSSRLIISRQECMRIGLSNELSSFTCHEIESAVSVPKHL